MAILRITPGTVLAAQRRRIAAARALLSSEIPALLTQLGLDCAAALASAAPRGSDSGGGNPPGDAAGPLAASFVSMMDQTGAGAGIVTVRTTQPTKLKYVTEGTGIFGPTGEPIRPLTKKALYWKGAAHPVRQVKGQQANDFVSPVTEEMMNVGDERMDTLALHVADVLSGNGGGGVG